MVSMSSSRAFIGLIAAALRSRGRSRRARRSLDEHVIIVLAPLAGWAAGRGALEDELSHFIPMALLAVDDGVALNFDLGVGNGQVGDGHERAAGKNCRRISPVGFE